MKNRMIQILLALTLGFAGTQARAASVASVQGFCSSGGAKVVTQGMNSTTTVQASYPDCTVTVYLTGTTTLATIYQNSGLSPLSNPFTANKNASWLFYATSGTGLDIVLSGGTPNAFPTPYTLVDVSPGGGGGGGGNVPPPAFSVPFANSEASAFQSDTPFGYAPSTHQLLTESQIVNETNTPSAIGIQLNVDETDGTASRLGQQHDSTYSGHGWSYGNIEGLSNGAPAWSTDGDHYQLINFYRRGIQQMASGNAEKLATGDFGSLYFYGFCAGGVTGASDEGCTEMSLRGGDVNYYPSLTAAGSPGAGATAIPYQPESGSYPPTIDGSYLVDKTQGGTQFNATANATHVSYGVGPGFYEVPVSGITLTPSVIGVMNCNLAQLQVDDGTGTVPVTGCQVENLNGSLVTGTATLDGEIEQISITASGPSSGGNQTITINNYHRPHVAGQYNIYQGGTGIGNVAESLFYDGITGVPGEMYPVFGSADSSHLVMGVLVGGGTSAPPINYFPPITLSSMTRSGSTVTAIPGGSFSTSAGLFLNNMTGVVIAGCAQASFNGTVSDMQYSVATGTFTYTQAGSDTSCPGGATATAPNPVNQFALYPYAEVIEGYDGTGTIQVENNSVNWTSGDSLVQPHLTWSGTGIWVTHERNSVTGAGTSSGFLLEGENDGICCGYSMVQIRNIANNVDLYQGIGNGRLAAPTAISISGSFGPILNAPIPVDGSAMLNFTCVISPGCSDAVNPLFINSPTRASGFFYFPSNNKWLIGPSVNSASGELDAGSFVASTSTAGAQILQLIDVASIGHNTGPCIGWNTPLDTSYNPYALICASVNFGELSYLDFDVDNTNTHPIEIAGGRGNGYTTTFNSSVLMPTLYNSATVAGVGIGTNGALSTFNLASAAITSGNISGVTITNTAFNTGNLFAMNGCYPSTTASYMFWTDSPTDSTKFCRIDTNHIGFIENSGTILEMVDSILPGGAVLLDIETDGLHSTAPTQTTTDTSTALANDEFVHNVVSGYSNAALVIGSETCVVSNGLIKSCTP